MTDAASVLARVVPKRVLVTRGLARGRVALTFEGGPCDVTARLLDACDDVGLAATFFVVGERAAERADILREYVRRGHEVAGLGFTGRPFPELAPAVLVDELARTSDLLPPSRTRTPFVRPPRGEVTVGAIARVVAAGYTSVLWSIDARDDEARDAGEIAERVAGARGGDIVRLRETPLTVEALREIVARLRGAGLLPCTLSESLGV